MSSQKLEDTSAMTATNAVLAKDEQARTTELANLIVGKIVETGGACATDLAGQIGGGVRPDDVAPILESLVESGKIRPRIDKTDPRTYNRFQVRYELSR